MRREMNQVRCLSARLPGRAVGLILLVCWPLFLQGQSTYPNSRAWIDSVFSLLDKEAGLDPGQQSDLVEQVEILARLIEDPCSRAGAAIRAATLLDVRGLADSALVKLLYAGRWIHQGSCDTTLRLFHAVRLGSIYLTLHAYDKVDSISALALPWAGRIASFSSDRFALLNNQAIAYFYQERLDEALRLFHLSLAEASRAGDSVWMQKTMVNLGSLKGYDGDLDSARYYLGKAAGLSREIRNFDGYLTLLVNLANLDREEGQYHMALDRLVEAEILADSLSRLEIQADIQKARAATYRAMHDYQRGYFYLDSFILLRERVLDEGRITAVAEMEERFKAERSARRIQQLELDKLDGTLINQRVRNSRNMYLAGGAIFLLLAIGLMGRLLATRRSRAAMQRQMEVADGLLLNILPRSVAAELKLKGSARARHYDRASILFSDFQDFTTIAAKRTPDELVDEVNTYFRAFDRIIQHYGLEKIKTIGDAYMCAAGIDGISDASAADAVLAGLAMQAYVEARRSYQQARGWPDFGMRLGIHSGPVVAGIVGAIKFQYDLWGDTVNTASRMENLGAVGQVNISAVTYALVREDPRLRFTDRGLVEVKGKGLMALYFVEAIGTSDPTRKLVRELVAGDQDLRFAAQV